MIIRSARFEDCDDLGLVIVTATLGTFLGRIPECDLDFSWTPQRSAANWKRDFERISGSAALFYVAESEQRVVGYLLAEPQMENGVSGDGWIVAQLYVLPSAQRRGVGRALLAHLAAELKRRAVRSLQIGCVEENPSCGFYLHLGGTEIGRRPATVDRFQTREIIFEWPDVEALICIDRSRLRG